MNSQTLQLRIVSPKQDIFQGPVSSISSINSAGPFDILPEHANFITLVSNSPITIRTTDNREQTFNFPLAIVYAQNNKVNIYTDIQIELKS